MEGEGILSSITPPIFDGENYQVWVVRMEAYMDACDLWEAVDSVIVRKEGPAPSCSRIVALSFSTL
uniref:Putative ovule protein n=1 Tax=Solanum chacoense TaxID=4108 RepID=A0A0V0GFQ1_SOLCH